MNFSFPTKHQLYFGSLATKNLTCMPFRWTRVLWDTSEKGKYKWLHTFFFFFFFVDSLNAASHLAPSVLMLNYMSSCRSKVLLGLFIDNHTGSAGRPFLSIHLSLWESESAYGQIPGREIISSHHLSEGIMNMTFITEAIPKPHNYISSFWQQAKWGISPWTVLDALTTTRGGRSQKWIIHTVTKWCTNYQAHLQRGGIPSRSQSSGCMMRGDGCEIKVGSREKEIASSWISFLAQ